MTGATKVRGYAMQERGYWRKDEILSGVYLPNVEKSWRSAHNEVTRKEGHDKFVVRLYNTDILTLYGISDIPDRIKRAHMRLTGQEHVIVIDNGGWCTKTTREHINNALARFNILGRVDNFKRHGRQIFWGHSQYGLETAFHRRLEVRLFATQYGYSPYATFSDDRVGDELYAYFL